MGVIRNDGLTLAVIASLGAPPSPPPKFWRKQMLAGAASLTMTMTIPGIVTHQDHIIRTTPMKPYMASRAIWCAVRLADPVLVHGLAQRHNRYRKRSKPSARSAILVAMSAVSGVRHSIWAVVITKKPWPLWISVPVSVANTWINWLHCRASLEREDERADATGDDHAEPLGALAAVGVACFVAGSYLESASELQRLAFRAHPSNAGELCTVGLWSRAAHINYLGYVLWRTGIGMVSAPPWSLAYGAAHMLDFRLRAVPLLRRHMRERYGEVWEQYAAKTAVLVPGLL